MILTKVIIATLLVLTINFSKAGATDVYAMTERTSQGAIFEWYVRMDTYSCGKFEESVEIVSLLHCYSMKLYSSRRRMEKIKEAINDVDES